MDKNIQNPLKYAAITDKVIGPFMKFHRHFGPGFPELVYHRCLKMELNKDGIKFVSEFRQDIFTMEFV